MRLDLTDVPSCLRPSRRPRRGVTLLELLVVITLIGLAAALGAPALRRERPDPTTDAQRVVAFARAAAVRRGETLVLETARSGVWTLVVARGDSQPLRRGTIAAPAALPARLLVSPLGSCLPDGERADAAWDPAACRVAAGTR